MALASDLKRIALGIQKKSYPMADRFSQEALRWKSEIKTGELQHYMRAIIDNLDRILKGENSDRKAEDALMYSTLIQNYVMYK